ncbi:uncharacterized protein LOC124912815 [Impatiens glandulifera]|uniref:uncharacterized protein LOC124912815 n=1 Tax=Impatiens glandulifera TaxID=253017 RepID=UPI001FB19AED|nr:uncharacterized protein LOC124912815 [Impatiens glandulifera]
MKMEEAFPCPLERTVAASLLLLSTTSSASSPITPTTSKTKTVDMSCLQSNQCNSTRSCSSSVISTDDDDDSSSVEIWKHHLGLVVDSPDRTRGANFKVIFLSSRCSILIAFQVVQRSRSKTQSIISSFSGVGSDSAISSSNSSSSRLSSSSIGGVSKSDEQEFDRASKRKTMKQLVSSSRMRVRSESILVILSITATSEVRIRQLLGDSPDTSKALRMLLKLEKIRRSGAGGRVDPYIYTIA